MANTRLDTRGQPLANPGAGLANSAAGVGYVGQPSDQPVTNLGHYVANPDQRPIHQHVDEYSEGLGQPVTKVGHDVRDQPLAKPDAGLASSAAGAGNVGQPAGHPVARVGQHRKPKVGHVPDPAETGVGQPTAKAGLAKSNGDAEVGHPSGETLAAELVTLLAKDSRTGLAKVAVGTLGQSLPAALRPVLQVAFVSLAMAAIGSVPVLKNSPAALFGAAAVLVGLGLVTATQARRASASASTSGQAGQPTPLKRWPPSQATWYWFTTLVLWTCAITAAALGYSKLRERPSVSVLRDHLQSTLAPLPAQVVGYTVTLLLPGPAGCKVSYSGVVVTTAPLYRRVDPTTYLRAQMPTYLSAIEAADSLLRGPNGARLRDAVGTPAPTPTLQELILLTTQVSERACAW